MTTVQQVARELGMTSQEVIARLKTMGQPADSHLTPVDESVAERLRRDSSPAGPSAGSWVSPLPAESDGAGAIEGNGARTVAPSGAKSGAAESEQAQSDVRPTPDAATESAAAPKTDEPTKDGAKDESKAESTKGAAKDETTKGESKKAKKSAEKKNRKSSVLKQVAELPLLILLAFAIAVVIKIFLVQAFFIPSASMNPTLVRGDRVLVEKLGYRFGEPQRGQVIVFAQDAARRPPDLPWSEDARNFFRELLGLPTGEETDFIKRIVAVGGDVVSYDGNRRKLIVNGERIDEPYIKGGVDTGSTKIIADNCRSMELKRLRNGCRVPAGMVFVMGDNRSNSMDSRVFGPVEEDEIIGRAWLIIWPPRDFGTL